MFTFMFLGATYLWQMRIGDDPLTTLPRSEDVCPSYQENVNKNCESDNACHAVKARKLSKCGVTSNNTMHQSTFYVVNVRRLSKIQSTTKHQITVGE